MLRIPASVVDESVGDVAEDSGADAPVEALAMSLADLGADSQVAVAPLRVRAPQFVDHLSAAA